MAWQILLQMPTNSRGESRQGTGNITIKIIRGMEVSYASLLRFQINT